MTKEEYLALKPGELIKHGSEEFSDGTTCVVVRAFDGESVLLEIGCSEGINATHWDFFPHECKWSTRIASL